MPHWIRELSMRVSIYPTLFFFVSSLAAHFLVCRSCSAGYTFNTALSQCVPCSGHPNTTPLIVVASLVLTALLAMTASACGAIPERFNMQTFPLNLLRHFKWTMFRIAWAQYQSRRRHILFLHFLSRPLFFLPRHSPWHDQLELGCTISLPFFETPLYSQLPSI